MLFRSYQKLITSHDSLKTENRLLSGKLKIIDEKNLRIDSLVKELNAKSADNYKLRSDLKDIAELESSINFVREEVSRKNHQLIQSTEEILRLKNHIAEYQNKIYTAEQHEKEYLKLKSELAGTKDELAKERDKENNLEIMFERNKL